MGIDGGGSTVRALITDPGHVIYSQAQDAGVNPLVVGVQPAAQRVQAVIRRALDEAGLKPADIAVVGIAIPGGLPAWTADTVHAVLPGARVLIIGDAEIALVGARGARRGVVILAGTGSVACAIDDAGARFTAGGRGYRLGDEGSGYWLGKEAIRRSLRAIDGTGPPTCLTEAVFAAAHAASASDLVQWAYHVDPAAIARLAPLTLEAAAAGDAVAHTIVEEGARELALTCRAVMERAHMGREHIAFAGGLLTTPNPLSRRLCELLGLQTIPMPRHPPVMGAALLALDAASHLQTSEAR
ncbi:MAG: hypothetical protein JXB47_16900 [Anaerolineae bacterium]|nr:hypothetical protein [Anaerolineae bacterium]